MPDTMFIKPARPGLIVRDPVTHEPLPLEGREVPRSPFWIRRLTAGDVVTTPRPEGASAPGSAESKVKPGRKEVR